MADLNEDPLVTTTRREAVVVFMLFFLALTYTVGYCTLFGYHRSIDDLTFVLGFPDWVFWGIVVPWAVCTIIGWWLSKFYLDRTPLEPAAPPPGTTEEESSLV